MREIEVGEYVRFEDGKIKRVNCELKDFINEHMSKSENNRVEFIGKINHSFNILQLIEVGDYVNGYKVLDLEKKEDRIMILITTLIGMEHWETLFKEDIKSIVTKEQFKE